MQSHPEKRRSRRRVRTDDHVLYAEIPDKLQCLLDPSLGQTRYRVLHGGRGSSKSWSIARVLLLLGIERPLRILCAREFQTSIKESVHKLLSDQIELLGLEDYYEVQQGGIYSKINNTEFIFKGLHHNVQEIKSTEGIDICWVEEAESVSQESWRVLTPTIRKPGSEIWVSFNPALPTDPTYIKFLGPKPPRRAIIKRIGWRDNPWLPKVLRREALELRRTDPEAYAHVWGGEPWMRSDEQILSGKWRVEAFTPDASYGPPLHGLDYGFAQDPTHFMRCYIKDKRLYIDAEERGIGWMIKTLVQRLDRYPDIRRYVIRADAARPETSAELTALGFKVFSAPKWSGSVEDGIEHLRSYDEIIIHPRCKGTIEDARLWRYKVDARTGDILPQVRDSNNHSWDAGRYALAPLIKHQKRGVAFR